MRSLLQSIIQPQENRTYRSSHAFFRDLSSCLFFHDRTIGDLDLAPDPASPTPRIVGWGSHIPSPIPVPVHVQLHTFPQFIATPFGIECQHFGSIDSTVRWANPVQFGDGFYDESISFPPNQSVEWMVRQRGMYVDIYPNNDSAYPGTRLHFPVLESPLNLEPMVVEQTLISVDVQPWTNIEVFVYQARGLLQKLDTNNDNQLLSPVQVNHFQGVFIFWDQANLRVVDAFQYVAMEYDFRSVLSDSALRKQLPQIQHRIYNHFVEYKYNPPKHRYLTERLTNHVQEFSQELLRQPFTRFRTFDFYNNMSGWEIVGLLYQYCSHPIFQNVLDSDLIRLFEICNKYSITTDSCWLLPFFFDQSDSIPLYGHRTLPNKIIQSKSVIQFWNPNDDANHCLQRLKEGVVNHSPFGLEISFTNDENTCLWRVYPEGALAIGRWNQTSPPHVPLILCPLSNEHLFQIAEGNIRSLSKTNQRDSLGNRIRVYNTFSRSHSQEFEWSSVQHPTYGWSNSAKVEGPRWEYSAATKWVHLPAEIDLILLADGSILLVSHKYTFILQQSDQSEYLIEPDKRYTFEWIDGILISQEETTIPPITLNSILFS